MAETPGFAARLTETWAAWRAAELADSAVRARIDGIVGDLGGAVDRSFERWKIVKVDVGGMLYPVGSHAEEIARVNGWLAARLAWMDANIAGYADTGG